MDSSTHPILPLRDIVIFPHMIAPLFVGRSMSINALETVMEDNKQILLLTQKKSSVEAPKKKDLFSTGTLGNILQLLKLPDGTVKVLVEGKSRCKIKEIITNETHLDAKVNLISEINHKNNNDHLTLRLTGVFEEFVKLNGKINSDIFMKLFIIY